MRVWNGTRQLRLSKSSQSVHHPRPLLPPSQFSAISWRTEHPIHQTTQPSTPHPLSRSDKDVLLLSSPKLPHYQTAEKTNPRRERIKREYVAKARQGGGYRKTNKRKEVMIEERKGIGYEREQYRQSRSKPQHEN